MAFFSFYFLLLALSMDHISAFGTTDTFTRLECGPARRKAGSEKQYLCQWENEATGEVCLAQSAYQQTLTHAQPCLSAPHSLSWLPNTDKCSVSVLKSETHQWHCQVTTSRRLDSNILDNYCPFMVSIMPDPDDSIILVPKDRQSEQLTVTISNATQLPDVTVVSYSTAMAMEPIKDEQMRGNNSLWLQRLTYEIIMTEKEMEIGISVKAALSSKFCLEQNIMLVREKSNELLIILVSVLSALLLLFVLGTGTIYFCKKKHLCCFKRMKENLTISNDRYDPSEEVTAQAAAQAQVPQHTLDAANAVHKHNLCDEDDDEGINYDGYRSAPATVTGVSGLRSSGHSRRLRKSLFETNQVRRMSTIPRLVARPVTVRRSNTGFIIGRSRQQEILHQRAESSIVGVVGAIDSQDSGIEVDARLQQQQEHHHHSSSIVYMIEANPAPQASTFDQYKSSLVDAGIIAVEEENLYENFTYTGDLSELETVIVKTDFDPTVCGYDEPSLVPVSAGEAVSVLQRDDRGSGWTFVRTQETDGFVPNFVLPLADVEGLGVSSV